MATHLSAGDSVAVTVLRDLDEQVAGSVEAHDGRYLKLRLDREVPVGTLIKIEWRGLLFLAEVSGCNYDGASYLTSLEIEHALFDTEELARLASRLLDRRD